MLLERMSGGKSLFPELQAVLSEFPTSRHVAAQVLGGEHQVQWIAGCDSNAASGRLYLGSSYAAGISGRNHRITAAEVGRKFAGDGHFGDAGPFMHQQNIGRGHSSLKIPRWYRIDKSQAFDSG